MFLGIYNILHNYVTVNNKKEVGDQVERPSCTQFGKEIKKRLVDLDKKQSWLLCQVSAKTGLYFDGSYLYKVMTGQLNTPKIVNAICQVLELDPAAYIKEES